MFSKTTIFILFFTLICFLVWLFSDLVKTPASFTPDEATQKALQPLDPNFDQNTINQISQLSFELPPYTAKATLKPSAKPVASPSSSPALSPLIPNTASTSAFPNLP